MKPEHFVRNIKHAEQNSKVLLIYRILTNVNSNNQNHEILLIKIINDIFGFFYSARFV